MKKFRSYIEKWMECKQVKGIKVSSYDIQECIYIYNSIIQKEKPYFINGKVKEILDKCGIKTIVQGVGWRIA